MHEMKLNDIYFEKVKSGEKVYEVRLFDEKRKLLNIGDEIVFKKVSDESDTVSCTVEDLVLFDSFEKMSKSIPHDLIGMKDFSNQKVVDTYHEFYLGSDEQTFGVVAIKVKLNK